LINLRGQFFECFGAQRKARHAGRADRQYLFKIERAKKSGNHNPGRCTFEHFRIRSRRRGGNGLRLSGLYLRQQTEAAMPLFHFNSLTGDMFLPDPEGEDLPDVALAREVAEQSAREALIEAVKTGDIAPDCIQVTDSEGHEVATVFLEDLLRG
jgi:Domain of unknown function (DUF6894)